MKRLSSNHRWLYLAPTRRGVAVSLLSVVMALGCGDDPSSSAMEDPDAMGEDGMDLDGVMTDAPGQNGDGSETDTAPGTPQTPENVDEDEPLPSDVEENLPEEDVTEPFGSDPNDTENPDDPEDPLSDPPEDPETEPEPAVPPLDPANLPAGEQVGSSWLEANTVSLRVSIPLSVQHQILDAQSLANQLEGYDPGSLLRCELAGQGAYDGAIDQIGGVSWGYGVGFLEDQSKPRFMAGFQDQTRFNYPGAATGDAAAGAPVEIVLPDIVAVTESAALFYSTAHGILLVDVSEPTPRFVCASQLPGRVDQFFFHQGHLVAMTKGYANNHSYLVHFTVDGIQLGFAEAVDLGQVNILDSRRFNEKLVFYTDLRLPETPADETPIEGSGGVGIAPPYYPYYPPQANHRALRVFNLGDALEEELYDTLIDTTLEEDQLVYEAVTPETPLGSTVSESRRFGYDMWASDHYFVVTEEIRKTILEGRQTRTYSVCTASHTEEIPYQYCWTEYEERPNPDYVPPDNSGGDRSCEGQTLSDCLRQVARVSNETIMVPVAKHCEERTRHKWVCDARESRSVEYPVFRYEHDTQLYIYEYNEDGFVRLDSEVHEIENEGLESQSEDAQVSVLTTSAESYDLAVPGAIQTLYFQNGYLYVISEGVLQVYTMGGSSMVRTATLQVVNESLQSSLFSEDKLFLSDFGWVGGDHSTLKVVNLSNPAFPTAEAATHELPGGHRSIIASDYGIFTIGSVNQFEGQTINALKLGLFSDPYVEETAYSILATDLNGAWLGDERAQLFDGAAQRLFLPYYGRSDDNRTVHRVGVSRLEADTIVSEGAVVVAEAAQRVRSMPSSEDGYLSFATNSIYQLLPEGDEWAPSTVLEYFVPTHVYRLTEEDDYVELQRLGERCKLYFSNAADINERESGKTTEEFTCRGYPQAYENRLVFGEEGVEFDAEEASFRLLESDEIAATYEAIQDRIICLLSLDFVLYPYAIDYQNLPEQVEVTCVHPDDFAALQQAVQESL